MPAPANPISVCAVNFLNTLPLVWGMLHGPQRPEVELTFELPSICAEVLERGGARIGLAPVAEIARQGLATAPGYGIACHGAVRSILLVSRVPFDEIRTLAADLGSRTSVELARVILRERYHAAPEFRRRPPVLSEMLAECDAALVIGDAALRLDVDRLRFPALDLGAEWLALTGLPMVFAAWAGKPPLALDRLAEILGGSYEFGKARIDEIVEHEHQARGVSRELAHHYLTRCIHYELGAAEQSGLEAFLTLSGLRRETAEPAGSR